MSSYCVCELEKKKSTISFESVMQKLSVFVFMRLQAACSSTCPSAENLHHRRREEAHLVCPTVGIGDVTFPAAVWVLLQDLTSSNKIVKQIIYSRIKVNCSRVTNVLAKEVFDKSDKKDIWQI